MPTTLTQPDLMRPTLQNRRRNQGRAKAGAKAG